MPLLDVSFVTMDPMLADTFMLFRRKDEVSEDGVTTPTTSDAFGPLLGVVTQQDPAELMRRDDSQSVPRNIFIATTFAVRGPSLEGGQQYQPDQIMWPCSPTGAAVCGSILYTVRQVFPYSRFGAGTYEVVAESMNAVDPPP